MARAAARPPRASRSTRERGVFMISVAAELAEMHPQTLRMYEQRGLIEPQRSPKGTRLYSQDDVERLRRIQEMTTELGLNLAGVERVLELEHQLERAQRQLDALERRSREMRAELEAEMETRPRARFRAELVPFRHSTALVRASDAPRPGPHLIPDDETAPRANPPPEAHDEYQPRPHPPRPSRPRGRGASRAFTRGAAAAERVSPSSERDRGGEAGQDPARALSAPGPGCGPSPRARGTASTRIRCGPGLGRRARGRGPSTRGTARARP